jgi:hypothetical protein
MPAQLPPSLSQRLHWYAYVIGSVPAHVPLLAVSCWPSVADPEIVGGAVLFGTAVAAACDGPVTSPAAMTAITPVAAVTRAMNFTVLRRVLADSGVM